MSEHKSLGEFSFRVWWSRHIVYRRTASMRKVYVYGRRWTLSFGYINGRWVCVLDRFKEGDRAIG